MSLLIHPKKEIIWRTFQQSLPELNRLLLFYQNGCKTKARLTKAKDGGYLWQTEEDGFTIHACDSDYWIYVKERTL